jgi:hypothetical protein
LAVPAGGVKGMSQFYRIADWVATSDASVDATGEFSFH